MGYIPEDIIEFLAAIKNYPTYSVMGIQNVIKSKNLFYKKEKQ
jgi:hypothetical protein